MDGVIEHVQRGWRGSEDLWINAAHALLVESGVEAVKVMTLARALGLSRTSFYWHFTDRESLLDRLIERWSEKNTGNLVAQTEVYAETITEAVFNLFDCWITPELFDSRLDFAIRNWALGTPALKKRVEANDAARLSAIRAMFARFGYAADQADIRARNIYLTQVGYIAMMTDEPLDVRLDRMPVYVEAFTGRAPKPSEVARFRARHPIMQGEDGDPR